MIEVLIYDIEVTIDIAHGWTKVIKEIYVPNLGFYINKESCFLEDNHDRLSMAQNKKPIEVDGDLVFKLYRDIEEYTSAKTKMKITHDQFIAAYLGECVEKHTADFVATQASSPTRVHGEEAAKMIDAKTKEHFPDGIPCGRDISTNKGDYEERIPRIFLL